MKRMIALPITFFLLLGAYLFQPHIAPVYPDKDGRISTIMSDQERQEISLCLANMLWNQLSQYSPFYDFDVVMKNLDDFAKEKKRPLKQDCQQQLLSFLDKISTYQAQLNLKDAEAYLAEVATRKNVVEVVPQKLYYEMLQSGDGSIIFPESPFKIHLIESYLYEGEETVIQDTRLSNEPITLLLSDTVLGFAKGASGMTVGERRRIYIHPDLAYGKYGRHGFQQLMICDVERL